jgi:hypothetical protein
MLTLPQIFRRANGLRRAGARFVRFTDMKKGYTSEGLGYVAGASYSTHTIGNDGKPVRNDNPHKYVTVFVFLDTKLHVRVSCSCPDFLYRWEVALHAKDAAEIEYSNGDAPMITNPNMKATFCKHCCALYSKIESKLPSPR